MELFKQFLKKSIAKIRTRGQLKFDYASRLGLNVIFEGDNRVGCFSQIANSHVGKYSYFSSYCSINDSKIGRFCSIGPGVRIGLGRHPLDLLTTHPLLYSTNPPIKIKVERAFKQEFSESETTVIGNDVWIGANAILIDGVIIGDGAVVGAGAVVTKDVEPFSVVGGVPAVELRKRFDADVIALLMTMKWWDKDLAEAVDTIQRFDSANECNRNEF